MTNPGDIVRVRARRGGRASVYEANALCQAFSAGVLSGTAVIPNTVPDMNVLVGGTTSNPTVLIATAPSGYKIVLDMVGQQAIQITKPASNSRISQIVAYTNDLSAATDETDVTGSPKTCGLIVVNGTASSNPTAPTDAEIRTAITNDGGTGSQAAYAILADITVSSSTTVISNSSIKTRQSAVGINGVIDIDQKYPIGSIYMSSRLDTPQKVAAELGGGTWVATSVGQVIAGYDSSQNEFSSINATGGSKTQELRATIGTTSNDVSSLTYNTAPPVSGRVESQGYTVFGNNPTSTVRAYNHSTPVFRADNGNDPSTLQPYTTKYIWMRTA